MVDIAVTGIRYALGGENDSRDKMTELAEELVKSLKQGTRVKLIHESDNPYDDDAVGVYMVWKGKRRRVGYISSNYSAEVRHLLGEDGIGEGEVSYGDGHITFFITLVGAPEVGEDGILAVEERKLPPYPLVGSIRLQTTEREFALKVVMHDIRNQGNPTAKNVREIISLLKEFIDLVGKSLYHEDRTWLANMQNLCVKLLNEHKSLGLTEQECDELGQLKEQVRDMSADFTSNKDKMFLVEVMEKELDEYRRLAEGKNGFFEKYDTYYLKESLEKADKNQVRQELKRLKCWLETTWWAELHNYKKKAAFAEKLKYARLSRCELHEIYAVLLLIERLEARAAICATDVNTVPNYKPKEAEGKEEAVKSSDPLRLMLNDDNLYEEVVKRLHACEKAEQVKNWVCQLIKKRHKCGDKIITGSNFVTAILPHLTNYVQSKHPRTLQNALL